MLKFVVFRLKGNVFVIIQKNMTIAIFALAPRAKFPIGFLSSPLQAEGNCLSPRQHFLENLFP